MRTFFLNWKHIIFGVAFVVVLAGSTAALFFVSIVGGNVYRAGKVKMVDRDGVERYVFKPGEWVYVKRFVCVDKDILAQQSPVLWDAQRKANIPLVQYSTVAKAGCDVRSTGFMVPLNLPLGEYEYRNVSTFQNNLVGRDEANVYPPVKIMVAL